MNRKMVFLKFLLVAGITMCQAQVSSVSAIQNALASASAGTTVTIANGTYSNGDFSIEAIGTSANPITIEAQTPGAVVFNNCRIKMGGKYIVLKGVKFTGTYGFSNTGSSSYAISFKNSTECSNCKVTQVQIDGYNPVSNTTDFRWIRVYGQDNEISYNSFVNKNCLGSMIFNQRTSGIEDRMKIHHNYFAYRNQVGIADQYNDVDVMRIGDSSQSLSNSSSEIYDNYFYEVKGGEPEIIANKSGNNKYYNNTFENYLGALSLRHGNGCSVYNNFFLNDGKNQSYFNGGIRIIGEDHRIYNNYIQGTNATKQNASSKAGGLGGINISATQADNSQLSGYGPIKNLMVVNNTLVNCDLGLRIGADSGGSGQNVPPDDIIVANNLLVNCDTYVEVTRAATNSIFEGNMYDTGSGGMTTGFSQKSGLLDATLNAHGMYPIISSSPAINASVGIYGQSVLTDDVFGDTRIGVYDVGAQEYGAAMTKGPYTLSDVGLKVGFGASEGAVLSVSQSVLSYLGPGGSLTFDITTETSTTWTIIENLPWVSVSSTSGMGSATITVTTTDNSGGSGRNAIINITANNGADPVAVAINQTSEAFTPAEITVVAATALGTEVGKENVAPGFAWDDNVTSAEYWSANATLGEASITFDLSCNHELTALGIHFLKADVRTTNFDVSVAENGSSTFTNILTNQDSNIESGSEATEQIFSLGNGSTIARYLKITGHGNSAASGWVSIAEVNIYGNTACDSSLSAESFEPDLNKGISIYPVPVENGVLNIKSSKTGINTIEIYNIAGQRVVTDHGNNLNGASVNVSMLVQGIYFITLKGIGTAKFVIK